MGRALLLDAVTRSYSVWIRNAQRQKAYVYVNVKIYLSVRLPDVAAMP